MEQIHPRQPGLYASCAAPLMLLCRRGAALAEPRSLSMHITYAGVLHDGLSGRPPRFAPAASDDAYTLHSPDETWGEDNWLNHYSEEEETYDDEEEVEKDDDFLYDDEEDWIDDTEYAYDDEPFTPDAAEEEREEPEEAEDDSYLYYGDDAYDED